MADLLYWVWLNTVLPPGSEAYAHLRASFSTPEEIYHADEAALRAAIPPKYSVALKGLQNHDLKRAYAILDYLVRSDIGVVTYDDPNFPEAFRRLKNPPVLMYYRGTLPDWDMIFPIAVVGSREHGDYAKRHTFEISRELTLAGTTIVSGMALGIDGIASAAALSAGGRVIEIIGSGIDVIYPKEHMRLAQLIEANGVIMTEYPPGTAPFASNFPKRNRLIAALARAVLVTSGKLSSGALITAGEAKRQGKDIFALPGSIDDIYSEAPSLLLREGAKAAVCAEDILFAYEKEFPHVINIFRLLDSTEVNDEHVLKQAHVASAKKKREEQFTSKEIKDAYIKGSRTTIGDTVVTEDTSPKKTPFDALSPFMQALYNRLPEDRVCYIDELITDTCTVAQVTVAITRLSIAGYVRQGPAGQVERLPL